MNKCHLMICIKLVPDKISRHFKNLKYPSAKASRFENFVKENFFKENIHKNKIELQIIVKDNKL